MDTREMALQKSIVSYSIKSPNLTKIKQTHLNENETSNKSVVCSSKKNKTEQDQTVTCSTCSKVRKSSGCETIKLDADWIQMEDQPISREFLFYFYSHFFDPQILKKWLYQVELSLNKHKFKCAICCKLFERKQTLKIHMRVHTREKPFACNICNRQFSVCSNLKRHVKNIHN